MTPDPSDPDPDPDLDVVDVLILLTPEKNWLFFTDWAVKRLFAAEKGLFIKFWFYVMFSDMCAPMGITQVTVLHVIAIIYKMI